METRNFHNPEQDMGLAADVEQEGGFEYTYSGSVKDIDDEAKTISFVSKEKLGNNEIRSKLIDGFMSLTRATNRKRVKVWSINDPKIKYISSSSKESDSSGEVEQLSLFS